MPEMVDIINSHLSARGFLYDILSCFVVTFSVQSRETSWRHITLSYTIVLTYLVWMTRFADLSIITDTFGVKRIDHSRHMEYRTSSIILYENVISVFLGET